MRGLGAMFFRRSGGAGRRGMHGRGHIRRARTESGPGGTQGARGRFALVTWPRALARSSHEVSIPNIQLRIRTAAIPKGR